MGRGARHRFCRHPPAAMTATLGSLMAGGYCVTAYCHGCQRSSDLDLAALAARHGTDARLIGSSTRAPATLAGRALVCQNCAGRNTSIRIAPAGLPSGRL